MTPFTELLEHSRPSCQTPAARSTPSAKLERGACLGALAPGARPQRDPRPGWPSMQESFSEYPGRAAAGDLQHEPGGQSDSTSPPGRRPRDYRHSCSPMDITTSGRAHPARVPPGPTSGVRPSPSTATTCGPTPRRRSTSPHRLRRVAAAEDWAVYGSSAAPATAGRPPLGIGRSRPGPASRPTAAVSPGSSASPTPSPVESAGSTGGTSSWPFARAKFGALCVDRCGNRALPSGTCGPHPGRPSVSGRPRPRGAHVLVFRGHGGR